MDGERFDSLIKRFTVTRVTRLEALRSLVGGAAVAVTGAAFASEVADAKKKRGKKKGKKSKDNQQNTAPYNPPSPPPYNGGGNNGGNDNHGTTTSAPTCDKHKDCGYGAYWDDTTCDCACDDSGYEYCDSKDAYDYSAYGTCVSTDCSKYGDYYEYDSHSCSCQPLCQPESDCPAYSTWSYESCSCECDKGYDYCQAQGSYYNTCVSKDCGEYQEYDSDSCSCKDICEHVYDCGAYGEWDYKTCSCKCDKGYDYCQGSYASGYDYYGTCVSTDCSSYYGTEYNADYCSCQEKRA